MGKKPSSSRNGAKKNTNDSFVSEKDDKIDAIRTWDDVEHDSEDEFFEDRDNILLNDSDNHDEAEESDREVYGLEGVGSESEEEDEEEAGPELEDKTWGTSKQAYYDADEGEDLDEMREEEEEALRIQKQHLAQMDEADFMDEWATGAATGEDEQSDKKLVEDVSKELEDISFDKIKLEKRRKNLPIAEKLKIIQNESPELIDLLDDFKENTRMISTLKPIIEKMQQKPKKQDQKAAQFLLFKYQMLLNYLTNISFYFALKASAQSANEVRDHPVIQALYQFKQTQERMNDIEEKLQKDIEMFINDIDNDEYDNLPHTDMRKAKKTQSQQHSTIESLSNDYLDSEQNLTGSDEEDESEESENETKILNEIQDIEEEFKSLKKSIANKKRKRSALATEYDDFEELDALDDVDREDKLAKKKSLRFYTAKIDAKQAKNVNKYQGDTDIPYKERNSKQQQKGVAQPEDTSADLDDAEWDEEDTAAADEVRHGAPEDSDEEYYENIAASKQAAKRAKYEEYEASRPEIETRDFEVDDGQKRLASYKILKNKGLTPHRKKENRNARVKHRNKYAKKLKKLSSTRAVHKMPTANYGGEMSGVKTNVIKSVKLAH